MMRSPMHALPLAALCAGLLAASAAQAQSFSLEGAVIDSRNSQNLGVVTERGDINSVFRAQKAMTFGILRAAGISLDQLPPEVRARIERFQTTNVEAFRAFSEGLDLKDQGKFAEAREFFRRAAELDPSFALAAEQQRSMPDINLGGAIQIRSVMQAAAGAAVDRGKAAFTVDLSRAMAAIQAGQVVIVVTSTPAEQAQALGNQFTSNPAGSGALFAPRQVAGLAYTSILGGLPAGVALVSEWSAEAISSSGGVLNSVQDASVSALRLAAPAVSTGNATLADGSSVFWGAWDSAPGASSTIAQNGVPISAPTLAGPVDFMFGEATRQMPTSNTAVFTPGGGLLTGATGTIEVNFATRAVALQNLGFNIGGLVFSGLNGNSTYDANTASGRFSGNYAPGATCSGCVGFTSGASSYNGNFVGRNADGLVLGNTMVTGTGSISGLQLFTKP